MCLVIWYGHPQYFTILPSRSERASATNNRGEQLRQGANINKSLLSLANCINALAGNRRRRGGKVGWYSVSSYHVEETTQCGCAETVRYIDEQSG